MSTRLKIVSLLVPALTGAVFVWYYFTFRATTKPGDLAHRTVSLGATGKNSLSSTHTQSYTYQVVNSYPHDPGAFTQGLAFEDGVLYEGTGGRGVSTLRKVELETGRVLQLQRLPADVFGEGIAVCKDKVIQLTYLSKLGLVYSKDSLELLQRFTYATEGWGLTYDGTHLVMSDGTSALYLLDSETFECTGQIDVHDNDGPVSMLNELEYAKGTVYANIWQTDDVVIISPQTGQVLGYIHLQGLLDPAYVQGPVDVLNGIAYDAKNDRLFVTGKLWPELFEIELVPLK